MTTKYLRSAVARSPATPCCHNLRRQFWTSKSLHEQQHGSDSPHKIDVEALLSRPTWSISSLLTPKQHDSATSNATAADVTPTQLHHLLRLSALPPPSSPEQEAEMLATLRSQLHFVRSIQSIDTSGVEPLRSLRDETAGGEREAELGMNEMREALECEEVRGRWHRRIRRKRSRIQSERATEENAEWDVLGQAERKTGRYFVVGGGKKEG